MRDWIWLGLHLNASLFGLLLVLGSLRDLLTMGGSDLLATWVGLGGVYLLMVGTKAFSSLFKSLQG